MIGYKEPYVIAEIGCNRELLKEEQYNAPLPNPHNSYGKSIR